MPGSSKGIFGYLWSVASSIELSRSAHVMHNTCFTRELLAESQGRSLPPMSQSWITISTYLFTYSHCSSERGTVHSNLNSKETEDEVSTVLFTSDVCHHLRVLRIVAGSLR